MCHFDFLFKMFEINLTAKIKNKKKNKKTKKQKEIN